MASLVARPELSEALVVCNDAGGIVEQAERRLQAGPYPVLRQISCEFADGLLVLRGAVGSYYLKQMAQTLVSRIPGVTRVDNRLDVITSR